MKSIQITLGLLLAMTGATSLCAQISAFTYQGRLDLNGAPANGRYDFMFRLMNDPTNGVAAPVIPINIAVPVTNGLFTTGMDFGAENFVGANRWLEINVRTNGSGPFTTLSPRQVLTPAPYAIMANAASNLTGALPANQISGTILNVSLPASPSFSGTVTANNFSGDGANVTNVNATTLGGVNSSNFWKTTGNVGTTAGTHFFGTVDNQPLELKANSRRALRLEAGGFGAPNLIGGSEVNVVDASVVGATIAGGGAANYAGFVSSNRVGGDFGTIGGGGMNSTIGFAATVGGGWNNTSEGGATVSGGQGNIARNGFATVSGGDRNISDQHHATVGGGGINTSSGEYATVGGGYWNTSSGVGATIAGGERNRAGDFGASIGGGRDNTNSAVYGTIAGGLYNRAGSNYVTVVGGIGNSGNGESAVVSGGERNTSSNAWATVAGGYQNVAGGQLSFAAGRRAMALHDGAFVWADATPGSDSFGNPFGSTSAHQFLIRAAGGVGINTNSPVSALHVNGGVTANNFSGNGAGLTEVNATTLGGLNSSNFWAKTGNAGTTASTHFLGTTDNQPLEFKVNGARALRIEPSTNGAPNLIGGSLANFVAAGVVGAVIAGGGIADYFGSAYTNSVSSDFASIGGGSANTIQIAADGSTIAGGYDNAIQTIAVTSTIGGGYHNTIQFAADRSTIGGGYDNAIQTGSTGSTISGGGGNTIQTNDYLSTIGGGYDNAIQPGASSSTISGGYYNTIQTGAHSSTIGGGGANTNSGRYATIPGGGLNLAGDNSFAAGHRAKASHTGTFVWADSTDADVASTNANAVTLRASGGYRFFTDTNATTGAFLTAGSGSWTSMSDRNAKENFRAADSRAVLEKVVALSVQTWNYKSQDSGIRHIGPMAQDFKAAFGVGESDTGISTVDADGVALAAIQGLNQKLEETRAENAALRQRLTELEQAVRKIIAAERQPGEISAR